MAEEKKPTPGGGKPAGGKPAGKPPAPAPKKEDPFANIVGVLVTVMVVIYLLNGFVTMLSGNGFISGAWNSIFPGVVSTQTRPIASLLNPIGARVAVTATTTIDLLDSPAGKKIESEPTGAEGKILRGPEMANGQNYWFVRFDDGKSGWVREGDIGAVDQVGTAKPLSNLQNPIGAKIINTGDTNLYDSPGGTAIATEPIQAKGTITKGPETFDGQKYYFVEYTDGEKGWVRESDLGYDPAAQPVPLSVRGILLSHTKPVEEIQNPMGMNVVTLGDTAVFDSPGGRQIGTQGINARGKITEGPMDVSGDRYYFVQFASGKSGWVKEQDVGVVTSKLSPMENFLLWFYSSLTFFKFLLVFICLGLMYWIGYIVFHLTQIRKNQRRLLYPEVAQTEVAVNPKWRKVLAHIESGNESDWKLAIIEADIMLEDILDKLHLPGETVGEKMKAVEKSDFATIDNAWEAHKIRNQIAHEGGEYTLTQHEARRVIALYQSVFEEFQVL
jgi:hypothetical protein